jgi:hypothetical protein
MRPWRDSRSSGGSAVSSWMSGLVTSGSQLSTLPPVELLLLLAAAELLLLLLDDDDEDEDEDDDDSDDDDDDDDDDDEDEDEDDDDYSDGAGERALPVSAAPPAPVRPGWIKARAPLRRKKRARGLECTRRRGGRSKSESSRQPR